MKTALIAALALSSTLVTAPAGTAHADEGALNSELSVEQLEALNKFKNRRLWVQDTMTTYVDQYGNSRGSSMGWRV